MKTYRVQAYLVVALLLLLSPFRANALTMNIWTGDESNDWAEPLNWHLGVVPTTDHQVVFDDGFTPPATISIPSSITTMPGAILFKGNLENSVTIERTGGQIDAPRNFTLEVEAGSAAHTFSILDGNRRLAGEHGRNHWFINHSNSAFTLDAQFHGWGGSSPWFYYQGSGDIVVPRGAGASGGRQILDTSFTGSVLLPEGGSFNSGGTYQVNGGTLIIDGIWLDRSTEFRVDGTVTGHGVLGRSTRSEPNIKNTVFRFRTGSLLVPGRPGETGTLEFENHDLDMQAGSTMRFDLLSANPGEYDRLTFRLEYVPDSPETESLHPKIPEVTLGGDGVDTGVTLDLNFLPGFSASLWQKFELLSGYDEIHGIFLGLPDKHEWDEVVGGDEYTFRIDYGASETTLTVIPEPSAVALLLAGAVGVLALRRRRS